MKRALAPAVAGMLVSVTAAAGNKGSIEEAKALLDKAIAAVTADEVKALAAFNDPGGGYVDRDLYVFCFDMSGRMTASGANPSRVGADVMTLNGPAGNRSTESGRRGSAWGRSSSGSARGGSGGRREAGSV